MITGLATKMTFGKNTSKLDVSPRDISFQFNTTCSISLLPVTLVTMNNSAIREHLISTEIENNKKNESMKYK